MMKLKPTLVPLFLILTLTAGCAGEPEVPDWTAWRGHDTSGVAEGVELPLTWSADSENIRWTTRIEGRGLSQPIVHAGRAYVTTAEGGRTKHKRWLVAVELETGEILWKKLVLEGHREQHHWFNTTATPTAATDGEAIFVYLGAFLAAVSLEGEVLWQQKVDDEYMRLSHYGAATSPVLTESSVIVFNDEEYGDREKSSFLAAFDKATGEEIWRQEWFDTCCSYATPLLVDLPSGPQLIVPSSPEVRAFDPGTGEQLWAHKSHARQVVPTPVRMGNTVVLGGSIHHRNMVALKLDEQGGEPEMLWKSGRGAPSMASPVIYDGLLYSVSDKGIVLCRDPESGEILWKRRLPQGGYRSSLLAGDGKVYVTSRRGVTTVLAASREPDILAENDLGREVDSSPAVGGGCLLIRTDISLVCVEPEGEGAVAGEAAVAASTG